MRLIRRFEGYKNVGLAAERFVRDVVLRPNGLDLKKLRGPRLGRRPEGYVTNRKGNRIAVIEIKCVGVPAYERKDEQACNEIRRIIERARLPHGGIYTVGLRRSIAANQVRIAVPNRKALFHLARGANGATEFKSESLRLRFSRLPHHRKWKYGGGSYPGRCIAPHERVEKALSDAKDQLRKLSSDAALPRIALLVFDSGDMECFALLSGVIGLPILQVPLPDDNGDITSVPGGFLDPRRNRFVDGLLAGVMAMTLDTEEPHHRLIVLENGWSKIPFPNQFAEAPSISSRLSVGPAGITCKMIGNGVEFDR